MEDFDSAKRVIHIRTSKNETSKRVIPLKHSVFEAVERTPKQAPQARSDEAGEQVGIPRGALSAMPRVCLACV